MSKKKIAHLKGPFSLTGEVRFQFIDLELALYIVTNQVPLYLSKNDLVLTPISCRVVPKGIAFKFAEILDRNDAEGLPKGDVFASVDQLPEMNEDNYSLEDLIGFKLQQDQHHGFAAINNVYNFGASDIIECQLLSDIFNRKKGTVFTVPMIEDIIREIDFENKLLNVSENINYYIENSEG